MGDRKLKLVVVVLTVITLTVTATILANQSKPKERKLSAEDTEAVIRAKEVFRKIKEGGIDLSSGPCLSNDLMPDWVADIVHNPRTTEDDLPHNQCAAFLEGRAVHFVELDQRGNLVRVR